MLQEYASSGQESVFESFVNTAVVDACIRDHCNCASAEFLMLSHPPCHAYHSHKEAISIQSIHSGLNVIICIGIILLRTR